MTWGIVQGQAAFAAGGVSASGVRSACLYAVSEATNVAEEQVQGILEYPSDTRRLLQWHTDYTNVRRLTSMQEAAEVWTMTFTIEVPSMMVADIELSLRMIETNAENKTSEFSEILLRALLLSAKNGTTLSGSFRFLMLVFEDPQGTIDGFQQSVTAKEAAVLGVLLEGNATEVILQIDGVVAVASRVSSEEIMEAGSWTIGQTEEDGFAAVLPATTFGSLERQGIDVSEVVFVAMNLGTAVNSFVGLNDTFMGRDVIVRGSINMNLYDGLGIRIPVHNLSDPITFTLNAEDADCAVWDEELQLWTVDGLELVHTGVGNLTCATTHLSLFAGIARGFTGSLRCSQATLLTKEGFLALAKEDWRYRPWTIVYFVMVVLSLILLGMALCVDLKRYRKGKWKDENFLIVDNLDEFPPDKDEAIHRAVSLGIAMSLSSWAEVLLSALRDVVDEVLSKYFEYFGVLREACEAFKSMLDEGESVNTLSAKTTATLIYVARTFQHRTAHLNACTQLGVHPQDDVQGAVVELGILDQAESLRSDGTESGVGTGTPRREGENDHPQAQRVASTQSLHKQHPKLRTLPTWHHHEHHLKRNARLSALHRAKHARVSLEKEKPNSLFHLLQGGLKHWIIHGPIGSVFLFSITTSSGLRALFLLCNLFGSLALATLFMASSGDTRSRRNKQECNSAEDLWQSFGRLALIGIASGSLCAIPVAIISCLHAREFVHVPHHGGKEWRRQLQKWRVRDGVAWCLGVTYVFFTMLYVILFFANAADEDQQSWLISASISSIEDMGIIPMFWFIAPALLTPITIFLLMCVTWTSREEVQNMVIKSEAEEAERIAKQETGVPDKDVEAQGTTDLKREALEDARVSCELSV